MKYVIGGILLGGALYLGSLIGATTRASQDQLTTNEIASNLTEVITACQKDPSSAECVSDGNTALLDARYMGSCKEKLTSQSTAADVVWHYKHCH